MDTGFENTEPIDIDLLEYDVRNLLSTHGLSDSGTQIDSSTYGEYYFSRKLLDVLSEDSLMVAAWLQMNKNPNPFGRNRPHSAVPISGRFLDIASRGMEKWIETYAFRTHYSTVPFHIFEIDEKAAIAVYEYVLSLKEKAGFVIPENFGLASLNNLPQELKDEALVRWPERNTLAETVDNFSVASLEKVAKERSGQVSGISIFSLLNPFLTKLQIEAMLGSMARERNVTSILKRLEFEEFPVETAARIADALFVTSRKHIAQLKVEQLIGFYISNRFFSMSEKRELLNQFVTIPTKGNADARRTLKNIEFQFMLYSARVEIKNPARLEELFDEYLTHSMGDVLCRAITRNPYCPPRLLAQYGVRVNNPEQIVRDMDHEDYIEPNFFQFKLKQKYYSLFLEEDKQVFEKGLNQILAKNGMEIDSSPLSWKLTALDFLIEAELAAAPQVLFPGFDDPFGNDDIV